MNFLGYTTLIFAILFIAALSGFISETVGIINIGINGMMIFGGLIFSIIGTWLGKYSNYYQFLALFITMVLTGIFALLHAVACIKFKANHIVSGLAINILASGIGLYFTNTPSLASGNKIFTNFQLLSFDKNNIFNLWFLIAIFLVILLFLVFKFTKIGLRYRAIGQNPYAANALGVKVWNTQYYASIFAGMLAGLAGAAFTFSIGSIYDANVSGEGFIALAILIFGQWNIIYVFFASLLFSFLVSCGEYLYILDNIPKFIANNSSLFSILPFLLTIVCIPIFNKNNSMPSHLGKSFNQNERN